MNRIRTLLITLGTVLLALLGAAYADHESFGMPGMIDPAAAMAMSPDQWNAYMNQYDQRMDTWLNQQMTQAQQSADQAMAQAQRFFIDYYRQRTGDWATPDAQAVIYGDQLYCQDNPAQCRQAAQQAQAWGQVSAQGHAQRMADIQAWGQNALAAGQSSSAMLDANHNAWMSGQAGQAQAHQEFVQGVIWEQSTWINPQTGQGWSLPNSPQPGTAYSNGMTFNPATGGWSQNGVPLVPGN